MSTCRGTDKYRFPVTIRGAMSSMELGSLSEHLAARMPEGQALVFDFYGQSRVVPMRDVEVRPLPIHWAPFKPRG